MAKAYKFMTSCVFLMTLWATAQDSNTNNTSDHENTGRFRTLEFKVHSGAHLYTGKTLTSKLESGYGALEGRFGWQSSDKDIWGIHGYPTYGVGFYAGFIGDPEIFGNPNALYGFIDFPVSKPFRKNVFSISPAVGLTYDLNAFNPETNPLNDAIGSRIAVYFNLNFGWSYKWTREMDITYGIDFTHFSNGRTFTPNYGLNMFGLNLGLRYHYNADQRKVDNDMYPTKLLASRYKRSEKPPNVKLEDNQSINLYLSAGTVQTEAGAGTDTRYATYSIVLEYQHKFNSKHSISGGFDYLVDNSVVETYPEGNGKTSMMAVHAGYDFMFWRFTIPLQIGVHITDNLDKGTSFVRPAIRYDLNKWAYAQVGLKTKNGATADWVEFGVGFRPFKW